MTALTDHIRTKAYWMVSIRPTTHRERVDYTDLEGVLASNAVRFRGWSVPAVDAGEPFIRTDQGIGQDIDAEVVDHYEAWRFYVSGQFNHLRAVSADWRAASSDRTRVPPGFDSVIEVWEITFYLTEVFELAARLSLTAAGDDEMQIDVSLANLGSNRALVVGQRERAEFFQPYRAPVDDLIRSVTLSRDVLVSDPRTIAATTARHFLVRFGWNATVEQIRDHQTDLIERR